MKTIDRVEELRNNMQTKQNQEEFWKLVEKERDISCGGNLSDSDWGYTKILELEQAVKKFSKHRINLDDSDVKKVVQVLHKLLEKKLDERVSKSKLEKLLETELVETKQGRTKYFYKSDKTGYTESEYRCLERNFPNLDVRQNVVIKH